MIQSGAWTTSLVLEFSPPLVGYYLTKSRYEPRNIGWLLLTFVTCGIGDISVSQPNEYAKQQFIKHYSMGVKQSLGIEDMYRVQGFGHIYLQGIVEQPSKQC